MSLLSVNWVPGDTYLKASADTELTKITLFHYQIWYDCPSFAILFSKEATFFIAGSI